MNSRRRIVAIMLVVLCASVIVFQLFWSDPRVALNSKEPYSRDRYLAYAQPWGGDLNPMTRLWGGVTDRIHVDPLHFPDNSKISWGWPFWSPGNDVGVWAYNHLAYGNYDGGKPEIAVPPRQVDQIKVLRQSFRWTRSSSIGRANLLTEFYLRSDPAKMESKVLEIGWFLHVPPATKEFVRGGKQLGSYVDPSGGRWHASLNGEFLTFSPQDGQDMLTGRIDMLAALKWLQQKRVITGKEWFTGVAIGAEALKGFGSMQIDHWSVDYR